MICLLVAVFLPVFFMPIMLVLGNSFRKWLGYIMMLAPLVSCVLLGWLVGRLEPGGSEVWELSWVPSLGLNLSFLVDGISIFYGFIISGIGVLVCWYGAEYLGDKYEFQGRFYAYMGLFMTAMLGTVFSDNILLLFVFWEMTGIASFLLIGFLHEKLASRVGARCALIVTVGTGLLMLAGLVLLGIQTKTYSLSVMAAQEGTWGFTGSALVLFEVTMVLLLIGAFGKSAQFPFHFWLPGAMAAPTPVSAYLHSATMVKLGVFLTARLFPVFQSLEIWFWFVCGVGFFTMLLGAYLALCSHDLKAILAFSTVSQLGFLIGAYGLGGKTGIQVDFIHILSHVFYKGALFMIAGIVDHSAGTRDVRALGGLGRYMPLTCFAAAVTTASLAGLPLTMGFISKEILLADIGNAEVALFLGMFVVFAVLTVAFALRIFFKVFLGRTPEKLHVHRPGLSIQLPPFLLALAVLVFGVFPGTLDGMLGWLSVPGLHTVGDVHLALWHGVTRELWITLGIVVLGVGLFFLAENTQWKWAKIPRILRFDELFEAGLNGLSTYSKSLTLALRADWPPAYLPITICFLVFIFGATVLVLPDTFYHVFRQIDWHFSPLRTVVAFMICLGLFGVIILRRWATQLLAVSVSGFFLTFYFVLYRAPDLAMTQILVESASTVMILLLLSRFPSAQLFVRADLRPGKGRNFRILLSVLMGVSMGTLVLFSELHIHPDPIGRKLAEMSVPLAEGSNVVNVILVDFRGFDTMGEITVLLIATLGGLGLMMRYKRRKTGRKTMVPPGFFLGKGKEEKEKL